MKTPIHLLCSFLLLVAFLSGCGSKSVVVLLPDHDGVTGSIELANDQGRLVMDEPGESAEIASSGPPKMVTPLTDEEIDRTFGAALAIEPRQPRSFLLYFESGGTELTPESTAQLAEVLRTIRERDSRDISVIGHTDRAGSVMDNVRLSTERANYVRDLLVAKEVDPAVLSVSSHGEGNLLVYTEDGVAEPKNRRVEVVVK